MNTIFIDEEIIKQNKCNKNVVIDYIKRANIFGINKLDINILGDTELTLIINSDNTKYNISFNISSKCVINTITLGDKSKIQFIYNINSDSNISINKYDNCTNYKEMNIININNIGSNVLFNQAGISITRDSYDCIINHNSNNTLCNMNQKLVCFDPGRILLQVTNNVDTDIKNTKISNNNTILDLSRYQCEIKPNIYINNSKTSIEEQQRIINNIHTKKDITNYILSILNNKKFKKYIKEYLNNLGGDIYQ